jgi:hypothetical protein
MTTNTAPTAKSIEGAYAIPAKPASVSSPLLQSDRTSITAAVRSQRRA